MTKYKAGDKVTVLLDDYDAGYLNTAHRISFNKEKIIAHEPAPEPILRYLNVYPDRVCYGYNFLDNCRDCAYDDGLGQIKVTITGNDFTVERVR